MPGKVVDASVLAAIAFAEPRADEAAAMLGGDRLFAPSLLRYELCNIALKKARSEPLRSAAIAGALGHALTTEIGFVPVAYRELFSLGLASGLTAYDAAYLYVARRLRYPLVTFDQRLARAAL